MPPEDSGEVVLKGSVICQGVGMGRAFVVDVPTRVSKRSIEPSEVSSEGKRYMHAVKTVRRHIRDSMKATRSDLTQHDNAIYEAHEAIYGDETFHSSVCKRISSTGS
jgi:phosphoenolpyruvate-protein kinase (PTS system EI component)